MQQPLNGFQQVGHAIVPGNVLEYTDVVHESLGRREQGKEEGCPADSSAGARGCAVRAEAEEAQGTLGPLTELLGWGWAGQVLKYLGGDSEGKVSSTAAVHRHVCLLHAVTLLAHLQAKEVQVGQEMRPSPSASGKVNVSRLRHPQERAE